MPPPILVVDDDDDWRELARARFESEGFPVVEARDGREALDYVLSPGAHTPFCVLLDIDMPRMSGTELMRVLGSYLRLARIPVIVHSAAPRPARFESVSPASWLVKGTPWPEILATVEAHAPSHRRRRPIASPSGVTSALSAVDDADGALDDSESDEPPPAKAS